MASFVQCFVYSVINLWAWNGAQHKKNAATTATKKKNKSYLNINFIFSFSMEWSPTQEKCCNHSNWKENEMYIYYKFYSVGC